MSDALHRDDRPWWERDQRTWADAVEWFVCVVFVPVMVLYAAALAALAVLG